MGKVVDLQTRRRQRRLEQERSDFERAERWRKIEAETAPPPQPDPRAFSAGNPAPGMVLQVYEDAIIMMIGIQGQEIELTWNAVEAARIGRALLRCAEVAGAPR